MADLKAAAVDFLTMVASGKSARPIARTWRHSFVTTTRFFRGDADR